MWESGNPLALDARDRQFEPGHPDVDAVRDVMVPKAASFQAVAQFGSASFWGNEGRGFKSRQLDRSRRIDGKILTWW